MSENRKNTPNNKNIKAPKFNFYWIYGIIFVLFIGYQFFSNSNLSKNLSQNEFKTILEENDIERIVIVNKDIANIYIKGEALTKEKHSKKPSQKQRKQSKARTCSCPTAAQPEPVAAQPVRERT